MTVLNQMNLRGRKAAGIALFSLGLCAGNAQATAVGGFGYIGPIQTELLSFDLSGTGAIPLGRDPAGPTGANGGYDYVNSQVDISLSANQPSLGEACLSTGFPVDGGTGCGQGDPNPVVNNGDKLYVTSFFDVFFDVTITDADPAKDFAAPSGDQPDGSVISLPYDPNGANNQPARMVFTGDCIADTSKINYGCLPPVGQAYVGHIQVVVPLGFDINGNGTDDIVKFVLATHSVGPLAGNPQIQGANLVDTFDSSGQLNGGVQNANDPLSDPPFSIPLSGPTTASQQILYSAVPEPATFSLFAAGLTLFGFRRRKAV